MVTYGTMLCIIGSISMTTIIACMIVAAGKSEDNPLEGDQ